MFCSVQEITRKFLSLLRHLLGISWQTYIALGFYRIDLRIRMPNIYNKQNDGECFIICLNKAIDLLTVLCSKLDFYFTMNKDKRGNIYDICK